MRHLRNSPGDPQVVRRQGTLDLRAYPSLPGPEVPREVMTNELFAATFNASTENRRRFGRSISMDVIEAALRNAIRGSMRNITDILRETIETDPHLGSVLNKRFGSVANLPWDVQPAAGTGIDRDKAMFYAEVVRQQLRNMHSFRKNMLQLAWALFDGRACLEMQWVELQPGMGASSTQFGMTSIAVQEMDWIHPRRISFGSNRELRIQPENTVFSGDFANVGIDVRSLPGKFIWWTPQLFGEYPEREGLGIRCMYWSFFKRFAARERMILSELYGKPWRIITVDPESDAGDTELNTADEIVDALGSSYTARLPRGIKLEVISPGRNAGQVHSEIIEESDKQISKLVLGQTGTTDAVPAGLNSNQANVMQDEQLGVLIHDAAQLSEVVEQMLTNRIIVENFGELEVTHAPVFRLRADIPADRVSELARLEGALKAGLSVSREEAYELSGFSIPDPEQITIQMQQPPTPPNSPVAPGIRPMVVYPLGTSPDVGEQQPPSRPAGEDDTSLIEGSPAGAGSADSTVTVNEDRASRGLEALTLPDGSEDPRGALTVKEFNATFEEPTEEAGDTEVATVESVVEPEPAKQAMNGAQITSVLDIVEKFRTQQLEHGSALELLIVIFPFTTEQANRILGSAPDDAEALAQTVTGTPVTEPAVEAVVEDVVDELDAEVEEDEVEEDEEEAVLGLSRVVRLKAGEAENVATEIAEGEVLYGEAGIHAHEVLRALETTAADGAHSHVFRMPNGVFIVTELDGQHMHRLPDVDADVTMEDGQHGHALIMGGQVMFTGIEISAHRHILQVMATAVDGAHRHTMQVPNPENTDEQLTITSMTAGEFAAALRDGSIPTMIEDTLPGMTAIKHKKRTVYGGGGDKKKKRMASGADVAMAIKLMPNGKYRVTKEDGTGNLGEFDTREEAVERLGQVEGFKERAAASARHPFNVALEATFDYEFSVALATASSEHLRERAQWDAWVAAGDPVNLAVGQDQPETSNGSVEDFVIKGMRELTRATAVWANAFERAVENESSAVGIFAALQRANSTTAVDIFGRALERRKLQALMLGVLDNVREIATGDDAGAETIDTVVEKSQELGDTVGEIEAETSAQLDDLDAEAGQVLSQLRASTVQLVAQPNDFTKMPFKDAVAFFKGLNVLDKASFERAQAAIKQRSFTVAGIMRDQMLRTLQNELVASIQAGDDLRRFKARIRPRLKQSGFLAQIGKLKTGQQALNAGHIETVFRTNVLNTYNTGRYIHQNSPTVLAAFPVWEFRALRPTKPEDRQTHFAANGKMLMANDPFWNRAYAPFGFNCRCRILSRSRKFISKTVPGTTIQGLPDPGFTSGRPALALG